MARRNHINPDQLRMFMSAREISPASSVDAAEQDEEAFEQLMDKKLNESIDRGLYDDIARKGVKAPVQVIHHPTVGNILGHGNHRFASQRDIDPDALMPVVHTDAVRPYPDDPSEYIRNEWEPYETLKKYEKLTGGVGVTDSPRWFWADNGDDD